MNSMLGCITLLAVAAVASLGEERTSRFLLALARTGALYPRAYSRAPEKQGRLTTVGQRQSYLLGKWVRKNWPGLFTHKLNYNENYVLSSALDSAQESARALMLGLYDFGSLDDKVAVDKRYYLPAWADFNAEDEYQTPLPKGLQPFPYHTLQQIENFPFGYFKGGLCPRLSDFGASAMDENGRRLLEVLNRTLVELREAKFDYHEFTKGKDVLGDVNEFEALGDFLVAQRFLNEHYNLSIKFFKKVYIIQSLLFFHRFFRDPAKARYLFTEFARVLSRHVANAQKAVKDKLESYSKLVVVEAHELTFMALSVVLNRTSFDCLMRMLEADQPEKNCYVMALPASPMTFDVFQLKGDYRLYIEVTYMGNKRIDFCDKGPDEKSTVDEFLACLDDKVLKGEIALLREEYCVYKDHTKKQQMLGILAFCLVVAGFLGWAVFKKLKANL